MTMGMKIKDLRLQNRLSQEKLGELLGVSAQAVSTESVGAVIDRRLYRFEYSLHQNRSCRQRAIDHRPYGVERQCLRHG